MSESRKPLSFVAQEDPGSSAKSFSTLREHVGFVPNLFRALALQPELLESLVSLFYAAFYKEGALSRVQRESILFVLSSARSNEYCFAWHFQTLKLLGVPEQRLMQIAADYQQVELAPQNKALLKFALKLGLDGPSISQRDIKGALSSGLSEESVWDAVLTTALSSLLCTLSTGLGPTPDFAARRIPTTPRKSAETPDDRVGLYLNTPRFQPEDWVPFDFLQKSVGVIPNVFRAQTFRMDVLLAEVGLTQAILFSDATLTSLQKQSVGLAVAAANQSSYWMALHGEVLRRAGLSPNNAHIALSECAVKLATPGSGFARQDIEDLRARGFTDDQVLELVLVTGFASFLATVQFGLGATPDFAPPDFPSKKVHLLVEEPRPSIEGGFVDPDADVVEKVQLGESGAFEELIHRHSRRVYRTLVGILGDPDEARDAMQDTFLKAFQHLGGFQRRSKFSTWLVSIANNTGVQRLRERKPVDSLDDSGFETEEGFRPRQIQAWENDPEQLYSQTEMRSLIESGVMNLPAKYRVVVMLRDIEQLSAEDAASALGLGIPALKARLLRGRLMLREALAPHFLKGAKGVAS